MKQTICLRGDLVDGQRRQVRRHAAAFEGLGDQEVRDLRVGGQDRAVQVGADHVAVPQPLLLVLAVVARAPQHLPEGLVAVVDVGAAGVVLIPDDLPELRGFQGDVADQPVGAGTGVERQDARALDDPRIWASPGSPASSRAATCSSPWSMRVICTNPGREAFFVKARPYLHTRSVAFRLEIGSLD